MDISTARSGAEPPLQADYPTEAQRAVERTKVGSWTIQDLTVGMATSQDVFSPEAEPFREPNLTTGDYTDTCRRVPEHLRRPWGGLHGKLHLSAVPELGEPILDDANHGLKSLLLRRG
jgi:hypothetical protein